MLDDRFSFSNYPKIERPTYDVHNTDTKIWTFNSIIVSALAKDQINPKQMPMRSLDFTYHSQRDILLILIFDKNQLKYMENTNAHTTEICICFEKKRKKENTINPITMRIYVYYNRFGSLYYFKCCSYGGASFHPHIKYYCCFTFIFWLRFHSHRCYIIFFSCLCVVLAFIFSIPSLRFRLSVI